LLANSKQKDILLDFDENDPLLMVGRMCLAVTITLAFPMLVIPGRDIVVRSLILPLLGSASPVSSSESREPAGQQDNRVLTRSVDEELQEPLLASEEFPREQQSMEIGDAADEDLSAENAVITSGTVDDGSSGGDLSSASTTVLLCTSVVLFWSAGTVASVVSSIDVVWDLLGSSLSILMSYLIPAGTFLVITKQHQQQDSHDWLSRIVCWLLICIFVPLMFISTGNAIVNTFLKS